MQRLAGWHEGCTCLQQRLSAQCPLTTVCPSSQCFHVLCSLDMRLVSWYMESILDPGLCGSGEVSLRVTYVASCCLQRLAQIDQRSTQGLLCVTLLQPSRQQSPQGPESVRDRECEAKSPYSMVYWISTLLNSRCLSQAPLWFEKIKLSCSQTKHTLLVLLATTELSAPKSICCSTAGPQRYTKVNGANAVSGSSSHAMPLMHILAIHQITGSAPYASSTKAARRTSWRI